MEGTTIQRAEKDVLGTKVKGSQGLEDARGYRERMQGLKKSRTGQRRKHATIQTAEAEARGINDGSRVDPRQCKEKGGEYRDQGGEDARQYRMQRLLGSSGHRRERTRDNTESGGRGYRDHVAHEGEGTTIQRAETDVLGTKGSQRLEDARQYRERIQRLKESRTGLRAGKGAIIQRADAEAKGIKDRPVGETRDNTESEVRG